MEKLKISFLEINDISAASRVLSVAMLDNPLHVALFRGSGEKERKIIEELFFELFTDLPGITFLARSDSQIVGVMRMKSCDGKKVSNENTRPDDADDLKGRISHWHGEWARHDPSKQHWHLGPIGVLPSHQHQGIGTALLRRFCKEVDACKSPAYLETDTGENVLFYERFSLFGNRPYDTAGRHMYRLVTSNMALSLVTEKPNRS